MAAPPPKKGRLSLYEDLISDNARAEIKARDDQVAADAAKKKKDASLMFRPTNLGKKPNNNAKAKPKPRPNFHGIHKVSSSASTTTGEVSGGLGSSDAAPASVKSQKRGFEDWLANDDDEPGYYERPRQDRNAKKFKKNYQKNNKNTQRKQTWSYDDIYDPSVPVDISQYAKSEAAFQSKEMWKMRLFAANKKERLRLGQAAKARPAAKNSAPVPISNSMFAPPPEFSSFDGARPQSSGSSSHHKYDSDCDYDDMARTSFAKPSFAPPASLAPSVANLNREETADDAYARRLALSSGTAQPAAPSPPVTIVQQNALPVKVATPEELEKRAKAAQQIAALKAKVAAKAAAASASAPAPAPAPTRPTAAPSPVPSMTSASSYMPSTTQAFVPATGPVQSQSFTQEDLDTLQAVLKQPEIPDREYSPEVTIEKTLSGKTLSRGPIPPGSVITSGYAPTISGAPTYNYGFPGIAPHMDSKLATQNPPTVSQQPQKEESAATEPEERSKRPGQDGFAERLLRKMGWEKGQGLGASNDGITTAIVMKADKSKRVPGRTPGGRPPTTIGKIVGGHKKKSTEAEDDTPHGNMSEVIKLEGMLTGLDVDLEIAENNLMQEIGDHMGEMYGKVERLFIWRGHMGGNEEVFVRFTSQLSALRAVKGLDGEEFAGNLVKGKFWDAGMFERGEYL